MMRTDGGGSEDSEGRRDVRGGTFLPHLHPFLFRSPLPGSHPPICCRTVLQMSNPSGFVHISNVFDGRDDSPLDKAFKVGGMSHHVIGSGLQCF